MPMEWGSYCAYEKQFIQDRYNDLVFVFDTIKEAYRENYGVDGFYLNHTTLWKVCYIYANDLKQIRQFHNKDGGCDRSRRASLLARLIAKHRPVFIAELAIPESGRDQDKIILQMNEHYAYHALTHFLDLPASVFEISGIGAVVSDLRFMFAHRDPQIEALVCIARLFQRLADEVERRISAEARVAAPPEAGPAT